MKSCYDMTPSEVVNLIHEAECAIDLLFAERSSVDYERVKFAFALAKNLAKARAYDMMNNVGNYEYNK